MDPFGRRLYVPNSGDATVTSFTIDPGTGGLTSLGDSPVGSGPGAIEVGRSGRFCYTVNRSANTVSVLAINTTTGLATPVATAATGVDPGSLGIDPLGLQLFVGNSVSGNFYRYDIQSFNGLLTLLPPSPALTDPVGLTVEADGPLSPCRVGDRDHCPLQPDLAGTGFVADTVTPLGGTPIDVRACLRTSDTGLSPTPPLRSCA